MLLNPDLISRLTNKVYWISQCEPNNSFSEIYLNVRKLENRVLSDEEVRNLPNIGKAHPHHDEWLKRRDTTERFTQYLSNHAFESMLEIGCGNGWFSNQCVKYVDHVVASDINLPELEQGARVFANPHIDFIFWDAFCENPFVQRFDLIVLNASIQYFQNAETLLKRLSKLLKKGGEIHILDSPFYRPDEVMAAKSRSHAYYASLGVEELATYYHHHPVAELRSFKVMQAPPSRLKRRFNPKISPFGWYRWTLNG